MPDGTLQSPRIRALQTKDLPVLRRLVAEMQDFERAIVPRLPPGAEVADAYTDAMRARCEAYDGTILVAEVDGTVVGFVGIAANVPNDELDEPQGSYALVTDLAVTAVYRGQGIGRALLAAAEEHAISVGADELRIAVLADNLGAWSLYASVGFAPYLDVLRKDLPRRRR
ncbi:MAG TPA: GNAT family N-acetyltransferase [Longimicrobiales bacterium]|nr:GNAT family N-acetyltransferase [Longimicrobiales bacterium]